MDNDKPMTQREALLVGRHGDFHAALYRTAMSGSVHDLMEAYGRADNGNIAKLDEVFPEGFAICRRIYNDWPGRRGWLGALATQFPHLTGDLDEPFMERVMREPPSHTEAVVRSEPGAAVTVIELVRVPDETGKRDSNDPLQSTLPGEVI